MKRMVYCLYPAGQDVPVGEWPGNTAEETLLAFAKKRAPGHEWRITAPDPAGRVRLVRDDARHFYYAYTYEREATWD